MFRYFSVRYVEKWTPVWNQSYDLIGWVGIDVMITFNPGLMIVVVGGEELGGGRELRLICASVK